MPYLYAVQMKIPGHPFHPVKVGFSIDPSRRLDTYRGGPYPTEVLGVWKGTREDEKAFHLRFKAQRLSGEWFRPTAAMMAEIEYRVEDDDPYEFFEDSDWIANLTPEQSQALDDLIAAQKKFDSDPEYRREQRAMAARVMGAILTR